MNPGVDVDTMIKYIQSLRPCHCEFVVKNETQLLPASFSPGPFSVVIGSGPTSSRESKYFVQLCRQMVPYYFFMAKTTKKRDKYAAATTTILKEMYRKCPLGTFVKKPGTDDFYDVEDELSRSCIVLKLFDLRSRKSRRAATSTKKIRQQEKEKQSKVIKLDDDEEEEGDVSKMPFDDTKKTSLLPDDKYDDGSDSKQAVSVSVGGKENFRQR